MYMLFDIGGTKMRIAVSDGGRQLGEYKIVETPKDFNEGMSRFASVVAELTHGKKAQGAAGGIAGTFLKEKKELVRSPHLRAWVGKPIQEELEKIIGGKVFIENDAAIVGLGEALYGAGKGHNIVVYVTVSTGVGGARIVKGIIDPSTAGFEPGHQVIDIASAIDPVDNPNGTLENFISGSAMEKRFGVPPWEVTDKHAWEEMAEWLAYGLFNTTLYWSPEVIVLGGPMIVGRPGIDVHLTTLYLKKLLEEFSYMPLIKKAQLESIGGLYGALAHLNRVIR